MTAADPAHLPTAGAPIEALRQVKEVEERVAAQLAAIKSEGEAHLRRLSEEAAAAIAAARAEAEATKVAALAQARAKAEAEAAAILAEGRQSAQALERKATQGLTKAREEVLGVLLGEFRSKNNGS